MHRALKPGLKTAASAALIARGCVNVIGLDEIKREAGSRWEKMRPSIYAHLESLLRQKLGPTDFYFQLDDTSFLVTVPASTQEESQVFCLRVAYELHANLLGHCDIGRLRLSRATRTDGDILELMAITGEKLTMLAKRASLHIPGAETATAAPAQPKRLVRPASKSVMLSHQFIPMWDVQKEAVTTWRCVTTVGHVAPKDAPSNEKFKAELANTLSRIRHATQLLGYHLQIGERYLLNIPIAFDLLCAPAARTELTATFRSLSSALRPYLLFEMTDMPPGVPQSRISELVGALRPFCRGVAAQLPGRIPSYGAYLGAGLHAIGLSLAPANIGVLEMGREAAKLCSAAKHLHIKSFMLDIPDAVELSGVLALGANLVSSPLIGLALDAPTPIRRLAACDIAGLSAVSGTSIAGISVRTGTAG